MPKLVITRGYPGSGKTTWARAWVAESEGRARVNRDDLRESLFGREGVLPYDMEQQVTAAQRAQVEALLSVGVSVVVDDTNLRLRFARAWADLAQSAGAAFEVADIPVDADQCVAQDAARAWKGEREVGEDVIRSIAAKFPLGRWPKVEPTEASTAPVRTYSGTPGRPTAWIVDIDGTLANHGARDPYDTSRYAEDGVHEAVRQIVWALQDGMRDQVVVTSGRDEAFRDVTARWLADVAKVKADALIMRPAGDTRRDDIVKAELFWQHIAPNWDVQGCIDDRDRVVKMWRSIGLVCAQVAPGDF